MFRLRTLRWRKLPSHTCPERSCRDVNLTMTAAFVATVFEWPGDLTDEAMEAPRTGRVGFGRRAFGTVRVDVRTLATWQTQP